MATDLDLDHGRRPDGRRRRLPVIGAVAAVLALAFAPLAPSTRAGTATVTIADSEYRPSTVTIQVGDAVTWVQESKLLHTVTADGGAFESHDLGDQDTFGFVFERPGTYAYHCNIHPMSGKVIVLAAGTSPSGSALPSATAASSSSPAPSVAASGGAVGPSPVTLSAAPVDSPPPAAEAGNQVSPLAIAAVIGIGLVALLMLLFVIPARRTPKPDDQG